MMPRQTRQQGVVLIVVLIMLVIIGLTSAAVMRNALTADLVSANVRSEALATEAAQLALAFCENQILPQPPKITIRTPLGPGLGAHWENIANWKSTAAAPPTALTLDQLRATDSSFNANFLPQCMAESQQLVGQADSVVIVTARGFSPDYRENATTGAAEAGAVVWLQSTLRF